MPSKQQLFSYFPGLFFCCFISLFALLFSSFVPQVGHISFALIFGVIFANLVSIKDSFESGLVFCEKKILELSIVLLGLNINHSDLKLINLQTLVILISMIVFVLSFSLLMGKLFRLPKSLCFLIGIGNAICGASAIMASSKVLGSSKKDTVLALAITNILGICALFVLPILLKTFDKDFSAFLIGGSLQAMGHVVASTSLLDSHSANLAITLKMARILLLSPVVIGLGFYQSKILSKKNSSKPRVPFYILGFIFCLIIANLDFIPQDILTEIKKTNHFLLSIAMVALGLKIKFLELTKNLGRNMIFASFLFVLQFLFLFVLYQI